MTSALWITRVAAVAAAGVLAACGTLHGPARVGSAPGAQAAGSTGAGTAGPGAATPGTRPSAATPASSHAGPVPWTSRAAPALTPSPAPSPAPPPAKYPPCTAAGLSGRPGPFGGGPGMGDATQYLVLTNVSGHACTLSGAPSAVIGVKADGSEANLAGSVPPMSLSGFISPANLRPGGSAQTGLVTGVAGCQSSCYHAAYTSVLVGIGKSGRVRVDFTSAQPFTVLGAFFGVTTFGVPAPPPPPGHVSPLDVLTLTIAMPATITAGTTVDYTVTLHNRSGHAVRLRPCPSYEEYVLPVAATNRLPIRRYYLNCQDVAAIPAHGSVTFAMRAPVPAFTGKPRSAKYGWILQGTTVLGGGAVRAVAGSGAR